MVSILASWRLIESQEFVTILEPGREPMVRSYIMYHTVSVLLTGSWKKMKESFLLIRFSKPGHFSFMYSEQMCIIRTFHPSIECYFAFPLTFINHKKCFHYMTSVIIYSILSCKFKCKNDQKQKSMFPVPHMRTLYYLPGT